MYRALSIPDILREIFEKITDEMRDSKSPRSISVISLRKDLVRAALTCHTFCCPALDALYKRLDGITPLLRLLPMLQLVDGSYVLTERLSCDNLTRFKVYASRVHEVAYHYLNLDRVEKAVDSSVYSRLAQVCGPILPNLRVLKLFGAKLPGPSKMRVFITSSLSHVEMDFEPIDAPEGVNLHVFETFLDTLVDDNPHLQYLTLLSMPINYRLDSVKDLKDLRSLIVTPYCYEDEGTTTGMVNLDMYRAFNSMKHLVQLTIDLQNTQAVSAAPPLQLDSLETMSLSGHLPLITHVIGILSASCLISFTAEVGYSTDGGTQYRSFFETLIRLQLLRTLNVVHYPIQDVYPLGVKDMSPCLSKLTRLEHLSLKIMETTGIDIDDEGISSLALALPKIQTLELNYMCGRAPTIACLSSFARHCPMLVSLTLCVDEGYVPSDVQVFSHGLKTLHMLNSEPESPLEFARFIDGLFPALLRIEEEDWNDVWDLIKFTQNIRKDHDRRMGYPRTGSGIATLSQLS